jgi:hypothetical protein
VEEGEVAMPKTSDDLLPNPHPGDRLREEFLKPVQLDGDVSADAVAVSPERIADIVDGKCEIRIGRHLALPAWSIRLFAGRTHRGWAPVTSAAMRFVG